MVGVTLHEKTHAFAHTFVFPVGTTAKDIPAYLRDQLPDLDPTAMVPVLPPFRVRVDPTSRLLFGSTMKGDTCCPSSIPVLQGRDLPVEIDDCSVDTRFVNNFCVKLYGLKAACIVPLVHRPRHTGDYSHRLGSLFIYDMSARKDSMLSDKVLAKAREVERILQL